MTHKPKLITAVFIITDYDLQDMKHSATFPHTCVAHPMNNWRLRLGICAKA
jgi:hypothetical protein